MDAVAALQQKATVEAALKQKEDVDGHAACDGGTANGKHSIMHTSPSGAVSSEWALEDARRKRRDLGGRGRGHGHASVRQ